MVGVIVANCADVAIGNNNPGGGGVIVGGVTTTVDPVTNVVSPCLSIHWYRFSGDWYVPIVFVPPPDSDGALYVPNVPTDVKLVVAGL